MEDFKSVPFQTIANFFSNNSSLELKGGKFVLTTTKILSQEEIEIIISKLLKDVGKKAMSFELDDEDDRFFCKVEEIILKPEAWLEKTVVEVRSFCEKELTISLKLNNFLTAVINKEGQGFKLKDLFSHIEECKKISKKLKWKGFTRSVDKEFYQLVFDLGDKILEKIVKG